MVLIFVFLLQAALAKKDKPKIEKTINIAGEDIVEDNFFPKIRKLYGVPDDFLSGGKIDLEGAVRESGGAHAIIAKSEDSRFLVKIMSDVDWKSLHEHLGDYYRYLSDNPESLLPRFFSAYKRKADGQYWVAMFNWLSGKGFADKRLTKVFDLKGTTCSHNAGDRLVRMNLDDEKVPTLKDLNFAQEPMVIHTSGAVRTQLLKQLTADTEFLRKKDLMDYSLIMRVMAVGQCDSTALKNVCPVKTDRLYRTFFQEQNGYHAIVDEKSRTMNVYEFGLIDVLQPYNSKKAWADSYKAWHCGDGEIRDTVNADEYQVRFVDFFSKRIVGDMRQLDLAECDATKGGSAGGNTCTVINLQQVESSKTLGDTLRSCGLWLVLVAVISWVITAWLCWHQTSKLEMRLSELAQVQPSPSNQFSFPNSQSIQMCHLSTPLSGAAPLSNQYGHAPSSQGMMATPSWGPSMSQISMHHRV